jgi:hypothetical protein
MAQQAIETALDMAAEDIRIDFQVTTQTWNTKPEFVIEGIPDGRKIYTENPIYGYVNEGTPPHVITAKNVPRMVFFAEGFKPKTKPGKIASYKGKTANRSLIMPTKVNHPGIQAREFSEVIKKKWMKEFPRLVARAIRAEALRGTILPSR